MAIDFFTLRQVTGLIEQKLEENYSEKWLKEIYEALKGKRKIPYFIESWIMERSKIDDEIGKTLDNLYKNRNKLRPNK
jgi:hypothetical protein